MVFDVKKYEKSINNLVDKEFHDLEEVQNKKNFILHDSKNMKDSLLLEQINKKMNKEADDIRKILDSIKEEDKKDFLNYVLDKYSKKYNLPIIHNYLAARISVLQYVSSDYKMEINDNINLFLGIPIENTYWTSMENKIKDQEYRELTNYNIKLEGYDKILELSKSGNIDENIKIIQILIDEGYFTRLNFAISLHGESYKSKKYSYLNIRKFFYGNFSNKKDKISLLRMLGLIGKKRKNFIKKEKESRGIFGLGFGLSKKEKELEKNETKLNKLIIKRKDILEKLKQEQNKENISKLFEEIRKLDSKNYFIWYHSNGDEKNKEFNAIIHKEFPFYEYELWLSRIYGNVEGKLKEDFFSIFPLIPTNKKQISSLYGLYSNLNIGTELKKFNLDCNSNTLTHIKSSISSDISIPQYVDITGHVFMNFDLDGKNISLDNNGNEIKYLLETSKKYRTPFIRTKDKYFIAIETKGKIKYIEYKGKYSNFVQKYENISTLILDEAGYGIINTNTGETIYRIKNINNRIKFAEFGVKLSPKSYYGYFKLAKIYEDFNPEKAILNYKKSLSLNIYDFDVYKNYFNFLLKINKQNEILTIIEKYKILLNKNSIVYKKITKMREKVIKYKKLE